MATPASTPTLAPALAEALAPTSTPLPTLAPPARLAELEGSVGPVCSLAWSLDGSVLASVGYGQVKLWDTGTNESILFHEAVEAWVLE